MIWMEFYAFEKHCVNLNLGKFSLISFCLANGPTGDGESAGDVEGNS